MLCSTSSTYIAIEPTGRCLTIDDDEVQVDVDSCKFGGLMVMISVSHTEGSEFNPRPDYSFSFQFFFVKSTSDHGLPVVTQLTSCTLLSGPHKHEGWSAFHCDGVRFLPS